MIPTQPRSNCERLHTNDIRIESMLKCAGDDRYWHIAQIVWLILDVACI